MFGTVIDLTRGGGTISTADESKNIFLKRNHNIILFSADSDRSHSVEHVGIFDHKKIPNIDQDIYNSMKKFWSASCSQGGQIRH